MRCCVPFCSSSSRNASKSEEVTFHVFPSEPILREAWLKALSKEEATLPDRSVVCSQHFLYDDFYVTRRGTKKVRHGAVPISVQVCMICLDTDSKLYLLSKYKLEEAYENLTGLSLYSEISMPQTVCVECSQRLLNCSRFRERSLRAHSLMLALMEKHQFVTVQNIRTIDREINQLTSNIAHKLFEPDHCDVYMLEDLDNKQTESDKMKNDVDDKVTIKNEDNDNLTYENNEYTEPKEETNENGVNDDIDNDNDEDYVIPNRDYSTDDSLPLETKRKKVKKEKVKKTSIKKAAKPPSQPKVDRRRKPFLNDDLNETLFTITDLSFDEQVAEIQKRQESSNYKNSTFKCTVCFKGFLDEDAYNGHMTRHTNQCGDYECDICKAHFKHPHALRKHITAHHTQRFSCNSCIYVTTHRQTARLHERWHRGTKYQCPHCPDEFVKFTTYMGHIRIKHPSDFVCALCGYSFVSEKGIDLHKKLKHRLDNGQIPEDGPFCEACNVRFVSDSAYKRHLQVSAKHNGDSDSKDCIKPKGRRSREMKEKENARDRSLEPSDKKIYPSQIRKAEGPIPCEQCGMQLEDSRAYHGHFRRHHPDKNRTNYPSMKSPFMCETCGRMFQSYALLKDHRWVHTGERPFACESCGKSFRMKQRLVAHRRVHNQIRATYVCNLCGKSFSTHSNRQRHMVIHTGLKPFKCEMCGKCFKHSSEKRAHITYVHLKKPWPKRSRGKRRERQGQLAQGSAGVSEMDIGPPVWGSCDPKMANMAMLDDKPMYYNIKM